MTEAEVNEWTKLNDAARREGYAAGQQEARAAALGDVAEAVAGVICEHCHWGVTWPVGKPDGEGKRRPGCGTCGALRALLGGK